MLVRLTSAVLGHHAPPVRNRLSPLADRVLGSPPEGNPFGLVEALLGLAAGYLLSIVALSAYDAAAHLHGTSTTNGQTVVALASLWIGFVGAVVAASRLGTRSIVEDYGLRLRPWPDIPLGIVVGVASQFLLVPLLELPLEPFVPHLTQRLGNPTHQLLGPASSGGTGSLVLVAVLICVGSPFVEELFFRGLVLRALLWRFRPLGRRLGPAVSIVIPGPFFGLVHFEALQFLGLAGFGMVLCVLAWRTGRLGPSIFAHIAFNTTTVIAYVITH
jgi:membrane protease YdiL (CAAX protease family)